MSRTVAAENAGFGITSNVVIPGITASSGVMSMPQDIIDAWRAAMPTGAFVEIEDIANAVAFFASPAAERVTGQQLSVEGGMRLNTLSVTRR